MPDVPSAAVGYKWLEEHAAGAARQDGRYCFVTHSKSIAAVQAGFPFAKFDLPVQLLDASFLKDGGQRDLTRSFAHWLYDLRDSEQNDLVDGVEFRSRYGDDLRMWAVFERPSDERTSQRIRDDEVRALHAEDPEMQQAFKLHGLRWNDQS